MQDLAQMRNHRMPIAIRLAAVLAVVMTSAYVRPQSPDEPPPQSTFEVASVRLSQPDARFTSFSALGAVTFTARGAPLAGLIEKAYGITDKQLVGQPSWFDSARYDVIAKPPGEKAFNDEQLQLALQQLLKERLHLSVHREMKQVQGYALVVAKDAPRLQVSQGGFPERTEHLDDGLRSPNITLQTFCSSALTGLVGDPVADATGIKGNFDIRLKFAQEGDVNSPLPSIFTALQEQLGLKLASRKVPLQMIVIDHVDRVPTEN